MRSHILKRPRSVRIIATADGFTMQIETHRQRVTLEGLTDSDLETFERTIETARRSNPTNRTQP